MLLWMLPEPRWTCDVSVHPKSHVPTVVPKMHIWSGLPLRAREQTRQAPWGGHTQAWSCASSHPVKKYLLNTLMSVWCALAPLLKSWTLLSRFSSPVFSTLFIYPRPCVHQASTLSPDYLSPELLLRRVHLYCICLLSLPLQLLDLKWSRFSS